MPNIKPVSDLRNYNEVLRDVTVDAPVFLTKNSRGCYVITDIREYERQQATIKLLSELAKSEKSVKESGWLSDDEVLKELGMQSFYYGGRIILTNGFIKKTQNTPKSEIERAKQYRKDFLEREGESDENTGSVFE